MESPTSRPPLSSPLFFGRDIIGKTHGSPYVCKESRLPTRCGARHTTCCKNDNEVITEKIAYAIVVDFPLFRFRSDIRYLGNVRNAGLNCKAEIARVTEFIESADLAFKEPIIEEIMMNVEQLRLSCLAQFLPVIFANEVKP